MIIPKTKQALVKAFWDRVAIVDDEDIEWLLSTHNQQVIEKISLLPQTTSLQQAGAGGGTPGLVNLRDVLLVLKAQESVEGTK